MNKEKIDNSIKIAWIMTLFVAVVTLISAVIAISGNDTIYNLGWFSLIDVALFFILAFGIYKRSRVASTIMFSYYVLSQLLNRLETGFTGSILLTLLIAYYLFQGMRATFAHHKLQEQSIGLDSSIKNDNDSL